MLTSEVQSKSSTTTAAARAADVQEKLRVGAAGDRFEQEAESVEDQIRRSPGPSPAPAAPPAGIDGGDGRPASARGKILRPALTRRGPAPESWVQRLSDGEGGTASSGLGGQLASSRGAGRSLPGSTQAEMDARMGADFSGVRVYTGPQAADLNDRLSSRAFTHGRDVYFADNQYNPGSTEGRALIGHELTHVVQQKSAPAADKPDIQRFYIPGVSEIVEAAGDFLSDQAMYLVERFAPALKPIIEQGPIGWLRDQVTEVFGGIVERFNALVPAGGVEQLSAVFTGLLERASAIVTALLSGDCGPMFAALGQLRDFITEVAGAAWDKLTQMLQPVGDFFSNLWSSYGAPAVEAIRSFAGGVWDRVTQLGRDIWAWSQPIRDALSSAWDWVKEQLFGPEEASTGESSGGIVNWFTTKLGEAWDWVKDQTRPVWEPVASAMESVRSLLPPAFISDLGERFQGVATQLNQTASQTGQQGQSVAQNREALAGALPSVKEVLLFARAALVSAKTWLIGTISGLSSRLLGFLAQLRSSPLLSPLASALGWIQGMAVQLTTWAHLKAGSLFDWMLRAFDFLMPFVERILGIVRRLIGVLSDLVQLPMLVLSSLWNMIPACIREPVKDFLINTILANIPIFSSLLALPDVWARLQSTAMRILRQVFVDGDLAGAAWTFFSSMLRLLGIPPELVVQILARAAGAIGDILGDPVGFLVNLMRAMHQGFAQFFANIGRHLLGGIAGWLFGHMESAGITVPSDFSLRSILGVVLQILDITRERIFDRLARKVGRPIVDKLQRALEFATGVWSFVSTLMTEGVSGLWEQLKAKLSGLWQTVLNSVIGWVSRTIITRVTAKLLSMLDPSGVMAVVNSLIAIYRAIQSFAAYIREMLEIVNRVLGGIAGLARGAIGAAAGFLESALSNAIPIAIGFLANQVGLGNLGRRIREMVEAVRERVDAAIDWLIERALTAGRSVIDLLRRGGEAVAAGARRVSEWWRARKSFRTDAGAEHTLYFEGSGAGARLMMRSSNPQPYRGYVQSLEVPPEKQSGKQEALGIAAELDGAIRSAGAPSATAGAAGGQAAGQQESAARIQDLTDRLAAVSARFIPSEAGPTPSTQPSYGGLTGDGYGSAVRVQRLGPVHPAGSSPTSGNMGNANWGALNQRRSGEGSYYIKGHLLNEQLGGPGNTWTNLTPLTRSANSNHEGQFESAVKQAVNGTTGADPRHSERSVATRTDLQVVNFVVSAVYGRPGRAEQASNLRAAGGQRDEIVANIIEAESAVPRALDCTATVVEPEARAGRPVATARVDNRVDTDLRHYSTENAPARDFYIQDHLTGEAGIGQLQQLAGVGAAEARQLQANGPYRRWADVETAAGVSARTIKATPGLNVRLYRLG